MTDLTYSEKINEAASYISSKVSDLPETCLVLGSGLGPLTEKADTLVSISYADIPHFPRTTVPGHEGLLIVAEFSGKKTFIMKGRFHY